MTLPLSWSSLPPPSLCKSEPGADLFLFLYDSPNPIPLAWKSESGVVYFASTTQPYDATAPSSPLFAREDEQEVWWGPDLCPIYALSPALRPPPSHRRA
ncbi:hypothetical protein CVT26_002500, partial [Gymnopilus dilepis]